LVQRTALAKVLRLDLAQVHACAGNRKTHCNRQDTNCYASAHERAVEVACNRTARLERD